MLWSYTIFPPQSPTHPYSSTSLDVSADLGPASAARPVKPAEDASCHSLKLSSFTESSLLLLIPIPTVKVHHRVLLLTWVWSLQQDLRHGKAGGGGATETGRWWLSCSRWVCLVLALHTWCWTWLKHTAWSDKCATHECKDPRFVLNQEREKRRKQQHNMCTWCVVRCWNKEVNMCTKNPNSAGVVGSTLWAHVMIKTDWATCDYLPSREEERKKRQRGRENKNGKVLRHMHLSLQWSGMTQTDKHLYTSRFALRWMMASNWTSSSSHCDSPTSQSCHNWTHLPPEAHPPQQQERTWWRRGCGGGSAARCCPPPSGGHPGTGGVWWTSLTRGRHSEKQCHSHVVEPPTRHPTCLVNKPDTGKAFWKTLSQSCGGTPNKTPNLFGEQARHRESILENGVTVTRRNPQWETQPFV